MHWLFHFYSSKTPSMTLEPLSRSINYSTFLLYSIDITMCSQHWNTQTSERSHSFSLLSTLTYNPSLQPVNIRYSSAFALLLFPFQIFRFYFRQLPFFDLNSRDRSQYQVNALTLNQRNIKYKPGNKALIF